MKIRFSEQRKAFCLISGGLGAQRRNPPLFIIAS
jgi:hypothetical protein